jgi:transcriptional regulator with XRE-family HTH domain
MRTERLTRELLAMAEFRENLVKLRRARQLTQHALAEMLAIQPRLVSRWETGEAKPQFDHMVRLAEVLEVSLDQLVRGEETSTKLAFEIRNKRLQELARKVDSLGREDQDVVCHVMDSLIRKEHLKALATGPLP